jgi:hypothetical protein
MLDSWREYNRECTSFVAWALASRNGFNMPFYDNANRWGPDARARGFAVNSIPTPGSVAWSNSGTFGHVAYVQDVSGSSVHIEEYNHDGTGHYSSRVVPASSFAGYIHFKDRPTIPPPAPPPTPQTEPIDDLGFVKTTNTPGTVEAHWDTVRDGAFKRAGDATSDFSPADAPNGTWQLFGSANGAPELGFIKLRNTGTGSVEVHVDTLQGGSYKRVGDYQSDFSPADAPNGTWQLFGSANGAPELGFIKLRNTGTGSVEVHVDTLQGGSYKRVGDYQSDFSPADAPNGTWQLFGSANGAPELGFIKLRNTSGTVEVHLDTLQGGTYRRVGDYVSDFSPADADNGAWNLFGSDGGAPRLGFVKLQSTGSGKVEGHADALQGSAYKRTADYVSDFSPGDAGNGDWQIGYP